MATHPKKIRPLILLLSSLLVSACGLRGPLVMPPGPPPEPILGWPKKAPPVKVETGGDANTPTPPANP